MFSIIADYGEGVWGSMWCPQWLAGTCDATFGNTTEPDEAEHLIIIQSILSQYKKNFEALYSMMNIIYEIDYTIYTIFMLKNNKIHCCITIYIIW